jgi:hypothetical protein
MLSTEPGGGKWSKTVDCDNASDHLEDTLGKMCRLTGPCTSGRGRFKGSD